MGRKKKPVKRLKIGSFYFLDRRIKSFQVLKKVLSRQNSLNQTAENVRSFKVLGVPITSTLMVASHEKFFGKEYSKIVLGNTNQETLIGYVLVSDLKRLVQGKLKWIRTEESS